MSRRTYLKCSVEECGGNVVARGFCDLHYRRDLHHGHLEQTRPPDWGVREKHPLYGAWGWMRRVVNGTQGHEWKDFWRFVADVKGRPSDNHYICRRDERKPFGPDNFFWRERVYKKRNSESVREYRARYMREYMTPERAKSSDLKKHYGITLDQYEEMSAQQSGVCAICGEGEKVFDSRTKRLKMLCVDHCHLKNNVRKLLCTKCNRGLGLFNDDPALLRKAAAYLELH